MKTVVFFLGHPAHFHLFKHVINNMHNRHRVIVLSVEKDVLQDLLASQNWENHNLFPEGRRYSKLPKLAGAALNLLKSEWRVFRFLRKQRADLLVGIEPSLAHIGKLLGIPTMMVNEDDTSVAPENKIFYTFATRLFLPETVDKGMWQNAHHYPGYHELAYLHPNHFRPNPQIVPQGMRSGDAYSIIRLASLSASHDLNAKGISLQQLKELCELMKKHGAVFISAEIPLPPELEVLQLKIDYADIHHILANAKLYIGDSQTMAMEAAILGTPAFRVNSFADKCSVILELEQRFELLQSFFPWEFEHFLDALQRLMKTANLKQDFRKKRDKMLEYKVNTAKFLEENIEGMLS